VAPRQEPLFFDDLGCLRGYLKLSGTVSPAAVIYVTDHRTGRWIPADRAVYTRHEAVPTPMGSHLIAHESVESRDADPDARGGTAVSIPDVFIGVPVPWSLDK
jgi:copper chaperone NosL